MPTTATPTKAQQRSRAAAARYNFQSFWHLPDGELRELKMHTSLEKALNFMARDGAIWDHQISIRNWDDNTIVIPAGTRVKVSKSVEGYLIFPTKGAPMRLDYKPQAYKLLPLEAEQRTMPHVRRMLAAHLTTKL
jgi:hypothetical protein